MLQVTRSPLEAELRNENAHQLIRLMNTYLPVNDTTGHAALCNYGLVHFDDDESYWHGSTFALSLANMTGSTVIDQTIPGFKKWDVGYSILEMRQWFELTVEALDNLVHHPEYYFQAADPSAKHTLEYEHTERAHWTFVRLNSFFVLEKSLKTLLAIQNEGEVPKHGHRLDLLYDDLNPDVRVLLRDTLHNVQFLRYPNPCPTADQVRDYLVTASDTYMVWRYRESSDPKELVLTASFDIRLGLGGILAAMAMTSNIIGTRPMTSVN